MAPIRKFLSECTDFADDRTNRQNLRILLWLLAALGLFVTVYSMLFHWLMAEEGREYSWISGIYWTLTVMSTLGFGDITFEGDAGRLFSMCVLVTGAVFLLVLLPFTLIQFFYLPWMQAQAALRAPRELPRNLSGHVIIAHDDPVANALIGKLLQYGESYTLLAPNVDAAGSLTDRGIRVVVGEPDDPDTLGKVNLDQAALLVATSTDVINTKVAFTARQRSKRVPIVATVRNPAAVDILELSGCNRILELCAMMGEGLARVAHGGNTAAHIVGQFDELLIAEAAATGTPMANSTLEEIDLRRTLGINVIGIWERGNFSTARPNTLVKSNTVLVMAGTRGDFDRFDEAYRDCNEAGGPVIIIGGGRVGRSTAQSLLKLGLDYVIVEQLPERVRNPDKYVVGDAAELAVLEQAGIAKTSTVIITSHDDDTNIYLTIYCRRLRPDAQIISRATLDRNVHALHEAGADFVLSYAAMGANAILHFLRHGDSLMIAEGLDVFKVKVPQSLADCTIAESSIRRETGCTIIALETDDILAVNPDPMVPMQGNAEMVLIGSTEGEERFFELYGSR